MDPGAPTLRKNLTCYQPLIQKSIGADGKHREANLTYRGALKSLERYPRMLTTSDLIYFNLLHVYNIYYSLKFIVFETIVYELCQTIKINHF